MVYRDVCCCMYMRKNIVGSAYRFIVFDRKIALVITQAVLHLMNVAVFLLYCAVS